MVNIKTTVFTPNYWIRFIGGVIYLSVVPFFFSYLIMAKEQQFNTSFVYGNDKLAQIMSIGEDNVLPGKYPADIYLNGNKIDYREVEFKKISKNEPVIPCLASSVYHDYGIQLPGKPSMMECVDLSKEISGSKLRYDIAIQRIDLDVPQAFLIPHLQDNIPIRLYDRGINAGFIDYNFNSNHNRYQKTKHDKNSNYYFLRLKSGINIGDWRLRNNVSIRRQSGIQSRWNNISSWAETDISPFHSRLIIGEFNDNNMMVFNGLKFRGVQLLSLNDRTSKSQHYYAPVVHGIALSNARVKIIQDNDLIYSTNVPAGPFKLTNFFPHSFIEPLKVIILGDNGIINSFVVPFSSMPHMLRKGVWKYHLYVGQSYNYYNNYYRSNVFKSIVSYGIRSNLTSYAKVLVKKNYHTMVIGFNKNVGHLENVSFNMLYSHVYVVSGKDKWWKCFRLLYSKSLHNVGTKIHIANEFYFHSNHYFFNAMVKHYPHKHSYYNNIFDKYDNEDYSLLDWTQSRYRFFLNHRLNYKRHRIEFSINQHIARSATLYANFINQSYWYNHDIDHSVSVGFNSSYKKLSYSVFYQNSFKHNINKDQSFNLTLTIPLYFVKKDSSNINATFNSYDSKKNGKIYTTSFTGSTLDDHRLNYVVQMGHDRYSKQITSANLGYQSSIGRINAGYSYSKNYQQSSFGMTGGMVLHSGGLTLTQSLQNNIILIEAKHAQGIRLENQSGITINRSGYAVMTSAEPYRHNRIALRTEDLENGLDIPMPVKDVVPTYGAIAHVKFETYIGHNLLIHSNMIDGSVLPIGANVFNSNGKNNGIVGTNGDIYISGVVEGDHLLVKWNDNVNENCSILVPHLQPFTKQLIGYQELSLTCEMTKK